MCGSNEATKMAYRMSGTVEKVQITVSKVVESWESTNAGSL